ncbi:MAG: hypothetical protein GXO64_05000 [Candidatus Micrarchaeota archaeon]|nr:hypothetical protein [Candidatus Micrarchaeota archaeon]
MKSVILGKLIGGVEKETHEKLQAVEGIKDIFICLGTWDIVINIETENIENIEEIANYVKNSIYGISDTEIIIEA